MASGAVTAEGDIAAAGADADCVVPGSSNAAGAEAGCTRLALRAPDSSRTNGDTPSRRSLLNKLPNIGPGVAGVGAAVAGGGAAMLGAATAVSAAGAGGTVGATGAVAIAGSDGVAVPSRWATSTIDVGRRAHPTLLAEEGRMIDARGIGKKPRRTRLRRFFRRRDQLHRAGLAEHVRDIEFAVGGRAAKSGR